MSDFINNILKDLKVDLTEAYDRNFERKAFFSGAPWKPTKRPVSRGSLLLRTSRMRNSARSEIQGESIVFSSSVPYYEIHNNGGTINRTSKKGKSYTINMPERKTIGHAPEVDKIVREVVTDNITEALKGLFSNRK